MPPFFIYRVQMRFKLKKIWLLADSPIGFFLSRDLIQRGLSSTAQTVDLPVLGQFFFKKMNNF
jgi:hypothetical protein